VLIQCIKKKLSYITDPLKPVTMGEKEGTNRRERNLHAEVFSTALDVGPS
jgi:hypothetical protein